jgi:hypothetical protein
MTKEEPNEFTVLLKIVEILGVSLRHSAESSDSQVHAELINIINTLGPGATFNSTFNDAPATNQEIIMGDHYVTGQAGAVGPFSQAANITFNQIWSQQASRIDLVTLAAELSLLRSEMRKHGSKPEDDLALAEVTQAEIAASNGDGAKSMSHLSKAGKWALSLATSIGAGVAVEAIKATMGI